MLSSMTQEMLDARLAQLRGSQEERWVTIRELTAQPVDERYIVDLDAPQEDQ